MADSGPSLLGHRSESAFPRSGSSQASRWCYARGMPGVNAATRLARMPALDAGGDSASGRPRQAGCAGFGDHPERLLLTTVLDRPAYRVGTNPVTIFADTGERLDSIGESEAIAIARRFLDTPDNPDVRYAQVCHRCRISGRLRSGGISHFIKLVADDSLRHGDVHLAEAWRGSRADDQTHARARMDIGDPALAVLRTAARERSPLAAVDSVGWRVLPV